jgi:hypothetical protein
MLREGGLVMLIPTSMDHSSGAIYLTNRDLKSEPYKLDAEFLRQGIQPTAVF